MAVTGASRILSRVQLGSGVNACWDWQGYKMASGYGMLGRQLAHRLSHDVFIGEIPTGLQIDHLCRNRSCVNPNHLEAVTPKENSRRGAGSRAFHGNVCSNGHDMTDTNNIYDAPDGHRYCRQCRLTARTRYIENNRDHVNSLQRIGRRRRGEVRA